MDDGSLLKAAGFSTTGMAIVLVIYRLLKSVKGKRFVSSCCGRKMEIGIDVQEMTPHHIAIPIENPLAKPADLTRSEAVGVQV